LVIATDMRKPPGVIIWRNGALATTSRKADKSAVSSDSELAQHPRARPELLLPQLDRGEAVEQIQGHSITLTVRRGK
jgi:hypothetical protein